MEALRDESLVVQFHALKNQDPQAKMVPWRLKMSLRDQDSYGIMTTLANNSLWQVLGATMKLHNQRQHPLCQQIHDLVVPTRPKKGKGKGKGKQGS